MTEALRKIHIKINAGLDDVQTLTVKEIAILLSISESKAYEITDPEIGDLPARKVSGSRRVKVADLKLYINGGKE